MDFHFHISSSSRPPGAVSRRNPAATLLGRAVALVFGVGFLVVAALFSMFFLAALAGAITLVAGYRLVGGRRARHAVHTIEVTPVKSGEPAGRIAGPSSPDETIKPDSMS